MITPDDPLYRYVAAGLCLEIHAVGSRVTCDPAPTDTDADYLVFVENMDRLLAHAESDGFTVAVMDGSEAGGSFADDPDFVSLRRGEINLIVTQSVHLFERFLAASSVAKRLNLLDKADRIALFQAVLYGNACGARKEVA